MIHRLRDMVTFRVERALISGPLSRLLFIALLIVLVSLLGGTLVYLATPGFQTPGDGVWWAFLRLSDPGYLGDDQGALKRTISTIITILGYVIFMGSMIAIMTQWLMQTLRNLERGLTPMVSRNHVAVLGWSNRTTAVLQELLGSQARVRRFLKLRGERRLRIAVLCDDVGPELVADLSERLGPLWNQRQVILRSGSPLHLDHLRRVDFTHAAVILLPGDDQGAAEPVDADTQTIKTLVNIASAVDSEQEHPAPLVVAEIHDARETAVASRLYKGPVEIIASGQLIGRLMAQTVRHPGLSNVYGELLQHDEGNEIYLRSVDGLAGKRLSEILDAFTRAIPVGVVRAQDGGWVPHLGLDQRLTLEESDRLVLVARSHEETAPVAAGCGAAPAAKPAAPETAPRGERVCRRILLLGWNQRCPALVHELSSSSKERFEVTIASMTPVEQRQMDLDAHDVTARRLSVEHVVLDSTNLSHLQRLEPGGFDNLVVMASARAESEAESDARTILSYLLFREIVPSKGPGPAVLVELVDPQNAELFETRASETIVSPLIVSHMLAQVALRRELRVVFDELFGADGPEVTFRPAPQLGVVGSTTFERVQASAVASGQIALGIRAPRPGAPRDGVRLNPPRDQTLTMMESDEIIVLARG